MVLNLGPAWGKTEAYTLFANNVIEIPFKDWETPAGLGICPLDVTFTACASISSWLNLDDDNIVVRTLIVLDPDIQPESGSVELFVIEPEVRPCVIFNQLAAWQQQAAHW